MLTLSGSLQTAMDTAASMQTALLLSLGRKGLAALRRTTHRHDLTWNSLTYTADDLILSVDAIQQPSRYAATNWTLALNGSDIESAGDFERQEASIYVAYISGGAVIGDALLIARGTMSIGDLQETAEAVVQPIDVESFWNRGSRATTHCRTDEGQRQRFATDRCFKDLARQREITTGGPGINIFR